MSPDARHQVEREELRVALERALTQHFGTRRSVKRLCRRVSAYSSSCAIENLEVELDRGQKLRLVFKNLSPASVLAGAKQVRPDFLYEPLREIATYENILPPQRLGTAICYGSVNSAEPERYWLFLERVTGPLLWQLGRLESWEQAARWLARLHSAFDFAKLPGRNEHFAHLVRHDKEFYHVWLSRAEEVLRHRHARTSPATCRNFRRLAGRYDRLVARLMHLPQTFIHGEFYPSNILVGSAKGRQRICPVDWELAGIASGLIDLAALTAGGWTSEERARMIAAYRHALEPGKNWPPSLPELVEAVECCQLHWCVQWLGWAPDWSPPEPHARNWLREAFRLADKLGL